MIGLSFFPPFLSQFFRLLSFTNFHLGKWGNERDKLDGELCSTYYSYKVIMTSCVNARSDLSSNVSRQSLLKYDNIWPWLSNRIKWYSLNVWLVVLSDRGSPWPVWVSRFHDVFQCPTQCEFQGFIIFSKIITDFHIHIAKEYCLCLILRL